MFEELDGGGSGDGGNGDDGGRRGRGVELDGGRGRRLGCAEERGKLNCSALGMAGRRYVCIIYILQRSILL